MNRQFDTTIEIENPMHSKIERGDRRVKREQITFISRLLQIDETELVMLWLADKFIVAIGTEKELPPQAFKLVLQNANEK